MPVLLGFLRQEHGRPPRHRWGWGQFWHLQAGVWLCPGWWVKDWGLYHRLYWHSEPLNIGHFGVFRRENDGFLNFLTGGGAPLRFGWNQCRTSPILYIYQDQSFFCWQVWPPISSHFGNSRYTCLLSILSAYRLDFNITIETKKYFDNWYKAPLSEKSHCRSNCNRVTSRRQQ